MLASRILIGVCMSPYHCDAQLAAKAQQMIGEYCDDASRDNAETLTGIIRGPDTANMVSTNGWIISCSLVLPIGSIRQRVASPMPVRLCGKFPHYVRAQRR